MSSNQKLLKVFCILSLVAAVDLVVTGVVLIATGEAPEPLQLAAMGVSALLSVLLFSLGVRAANVPALAVKMLPIIVVALLACAADVALALQSGVAVASACADALITVGVAAAAHLVNREHLAR